MLSKHERKINEDAYDRLKDTIKQDYPAGRFVAIHGAQIVADAANFFELESLLSSGGDDEALQSGAVCLPAERPLDDGAGYRPSRCLTAPAADTPDC